MSTVNAVKPQTSVLLNVSEQRTWRESEFSDSDGWITPIEAGELDNLLSLSSQLPNHSEGLMTYDIRALTTPRLKRFFSRVRERSLIVKVLRWCISGRTAAVISGVD
jgi:hypothetical protein